MKGKFLVLLFISCNSFSITIKRDSTFVKVNIIEGSKTVTGVGIPVYSTLDNRLIGITDSLGYFFPSLDSGYVDIAFVSAFYNDTTLRIANNEQKEICLVPVSLSLKEVIIKAFRLKPLLKKATRDFQKNYIQSPHYIGIRGTCIVKSKEKYLDFYQMDGVGLHSGNKRWKSWGFAPFGGMPKCYFYLSPLQERRSFHWSCNGDTIPPIGKSNEDTSNTWHIKPFIFRPVYRALEVSGPMFKSNYKYYDFSFNKEMVSDEYYIIDFKTKDRYKDIQKKIFLWGQGKLWILKNGLAIKKIEYDFSHYNKINLPPNRITVRGTDIWGTLTVSFSKYEDDYFIKSLIFCCNWNGNHGYYIPRPQPYENNIQLIENLHVKKVLTLKDNDLKKENKIISLFEFNETYSMAIYDKQFWANDTIPTAIYSDLSEKIDLKKQFINNSGKMFYPWNNSSYQDDFILGIFPKAKDIFEARTLFEKRIISYREKYLKKILPE